MATMAYFSTLSTGAVSFCAVAAVQRLRSTPFWIRENVPVCGALSLVSASASGAMVIRDDGSGTITGARTEIEPACGWR